MRVLKGLYTLCDVAHGLVAGLDVVTLVGDGDDRRFARHNLLVPDHIYNTNHETK